MANCFGQNKFRNIRLDSENKGDGGGCGASDNDPGLSLRYEAKT